MWFIELGLRTYFILKRDRFLPTAIFIGSASTVHNSFKTRRLQHASECCVHCHINFKYVDFFGNCRKTDQQLKDNCNPKHFGW